MSKNTLLFLTSLCLGVGEMYSEPLVEPDNFVDNKNYINPPLIKFNCSDTLMKREVLAWYSTKGEETVTKIPEIFKNFGPFSLNITTANIRVRASQNARFGLASNSLSYLVTNVYVIGIGADNNTKSYIGNSKTERLVEVSTPGILNDSEFREFWVRWENGAVAMGCQGNDTAVVSWQDSQRFRINYYGVNTYGGAVGTWKTQGFSWKLEDTLLAVTQLRDDEQLVTLPLVKTLQLSDNETWVYCAKQTIKFGGSFARGHMGTESKRIPLVFHRTSPYIFPQPFIRFVPKTTTVTLKKNEEQILHCVGSQPLDGRNLTWFRKGADPNLSIPPLQLYDMESNRLTLVYDQTYHGSRVFCRQGYVAHVTDVEGSVYVKSYGVIAATDNVTLFMKGAMLKLLNPLNPTKPNQTDGDGAHAVTNSAVLTAAAIIVACVTSATHC